MTSDTINGMFELLAAFFILNHCWTLYCDKKARGVSVISAIFFTAWGFWNMHYYPSLNQVMSFLLRRTCMLCKHCLRDDDDLLQAPREESSD